MRSTALWIIVFLVLSGGSVSDSKKQTPSSIRRLSYRQLSPGSGAVEIRWRDPGLKGRRDSKNKNGGMYAIQYGHVGDFTNHRTVFTPARRHVIQNLEAGRTYDVRVRWVKGYKTGQWSKYIEVQVPEINATKTFNSNIQDLRATPISPKSIVLSWRLNNRTNQELDSISLMAGLTNGNKRQIRDSLSSVTSSYTVNGLSPNMMYTFVITPILRDKSMRVKGTKAIARTLTAVPGRPPRITKTVVLNNSSVQIKWTAPPLRSRNGLLTGYKIGVRGQGRRSGKTYFVTDKSLRSFVVTGLQPNKTYRARIAAVNINGTGPYSKWSFFRLTHVAKMDGDQKEFPDELTKSTPTTEATFSTPDYDRGSPTEPPNIHDNKSPSVIDDLQVTNITPTRVQMYWSTPEVDPCCPVLAYRMSITNMTDGKTFDLVRGFTRVNVSGLEPGTSYSAKVTSYTTQGQSLPSEETVFKTSSLTAPPLITRLQGTRVVRGGNVNLTCVANGHEGSVDFTWFVGTRIIPQPLQGHNVLADKAGKALLKSSKLSENKLTSSLLLYNVTPLAQANYTCTAKNSIGSDNMTVSLVVLDPPSIVMIRGTRVKVGETAQLMCLAQGNPVPDIVWEHPSTGSVYTQNTKENETSSIQVRTHLEGSQRRRSYLSISDTDFYHGGQYTCKTANSAGRKHLNVTVNIEVPPPPSVESIQAIPVSPWRVSVSWEPPKNYTFPIPYYEVNFQSDQGELSSIIQTRRTGIELSNLLPNTEYSIGVVAGTQSGLGKSGPMVNVTTLTNVGLEPVNVTANVINFTMVGITWSRPTAVPLVFLRGYIIHLRSEGNPRTKDYFLPGGMLKHYALVLGKRDTLKLLEKRNSYLIAVSSVTTWDLTSSSDWIPIHLHNYLPPKPPRDVTTTAKLSEIIVKWMEPWPRNSTSTSRSRFTGFYFSFHQLHQQDNMTEIRLSPVARTYTMRKLDPATVYVVTLQAFNEYGNSEPVYIYPTTKSHPPSMVQDANAVPLSSTKIHIRWKSPKRGQVTRYHIRYWRPGKKGKQSAWVSGKLNNYVAGSLRKHRNYRFELIPYDVDRPGEAVIIFATTLTDRPDGPPKHVRLTATNATTLLGTWLPPDQDKMNGKITGYRLVLKKKDGPRMANFVVEGNKHNFTFLNMQTSTTYTLRVAAMNINGTGAFCPPVETSYEREPEIPAIPKGVTIITTDSSLLLQWAEPKFTGSPIFGYVVGYGQFIPDVFRRVISGGQRSYNISALKPDSEYIVSVRAFNAIGESQPVYLLARTMKGPALAKPVIQPTNVKVLAISLTSLNVSWMDPALNIDDQDYIGDKRFYQVRYSALDGEAYTYRNTSNTSIVLTRLEPSTQYELSVRAHRGHDVSKWSLAVVNSTRHLPPRSPPTNIQTHPVQGYPSSLELTWDQPDNGGGEAEDYVIHLTPDPSLPPYQWVVLTTHLTHATIRELTPHTVYYLKLQARNKMGYGPLSQMIVHRPIIDRKSMPIITSVSGIHGNAPTTVKVAWQRPETPTGAIVGYFLYYTNRPSMAGDWMMQDEKGLDTVITGLKYNTTYYFKVRARSTEEMGPFSDVVNYTVSAYDVSSNVSIPLTTVLDNADNTTEDDGIGSQDTEFVDELKQELNTRQEGGIDGVEVNGKYNDDDGDDDDDDTFSNVDDVVEIDTDDEAAVAADDDGNGDDNDDEREINKGKKGKHTKMRRRRRKNKKQRKRFNASLKRRRKKNRSSVKVKADEELDDDSDDNGNETLIVNGNGTVAVGNSYNVTEIDDFDNSGEIKNTSGDGYLNSFNEFELEVRNNSIGGSNVVFDKMSVKMNSSYDEVIGNDDDDYDDTFSNVDDIIEIDTDDEVAIAAEDDGNGDDNDVDDGGSNVDDDANDEGEENY